MRTVCVDLSNIDKKQNHYDWKGSIGKTFSFNFEGNVGEIKIEYVRTVDGKNVVIGLSYNGKHKEFTGDKIRKGHLVTLIDEHSKYRNRRKIGDIVTEKNGEKFIITGITSQRIKRNGKWQQTILYELTCLRCKYTFRRIQPEVTNGNLTCPSCNNRVAWIGFNDIPTTDPWMIPYFQGGEFEAVHYNSYSSKMIVPICPFCGKIYDKPVAIRNIYYDYGFGCECSDKAFFSEKVMTFILNSLNIQYKRQSYPHDFCSSDENKRYDFYIKDKSCIIETHGIQHYDEKNGFNRISGKSLKEQIENDNRKKQIAIDGGIQNYIIIDCRRSNLKFIKQSILESELPSLLNFSEEDINWNECAKFVERNIVKNVCDDFSINYMFINELCEKYQLSDSCVRNYLKRGNSYGWCNYNPCKNNQQHTPMSLYKNGSLIGHYNNKNILAKHLSELLLEPKQNILKKIKVENEQQYCGFVLQPITDRKLLHEMRYGYFDNN